MSRKFPFGRDGGRSDDAANSSERGARSNATFVKVRTETEHSKVFQSMCSGFHPNAFSEFSAEYHLANSVLRTNRLDKEEDALFTKKEVREGQSFGRCLQKLKSVFISKKIFPKLITGRSISDDFKLMQKIC